MSAVPILGALVFGVGSAFLPLLNAEAYAVIGAASTRSHAVAVAVALAVGQTLGKLVLFELARRGRQRLSDRVHRKPTISARWASNIDGALTRRSSGVALVLTSALIGLPPLLAVSVAAGASRQRRREFLVACFLGRVGRFLALTLPVAASTA